MPNSLTGQTDSDDRIVITGIGITASLGDDRESVWGGVAAGRSGVTSLEGLLGIPDGLMIGAPVSIPADRPRQMKVTALCQRAAAEAMRDAQIDFAQIDRERFGCAISAHMGDTGFVEQQFGLYDASAPDSIPWWAQWMPNTTCVSIANQFGLRGPRICHSTACASGLIDILAAVRSIRDGQCEIALTGSGEAFHPLFAAGFLQMRVLAHHENPAQACRPFDVARNGFVMGEGAAMLVVERLSHAQRRGAPIYAEFIGSAMHAEAHHVTGLDEESAALAHLIKHTLADGRLSPDDLDYINVHGTGTHQNDVVESRGIRRALGNAAADRTCVSAMKSMLGHLVNASGSVELALTAMAMRDSFVPPTANLTHQDPECDLDCIPIRGRQRPLEHTLKISVAFGGHLVAVALRRWPDAPARPVLTPAA